MHRTRVICLRQQESRRPMAESRSQLTENPLLAFGTQRRTDNLIGQSIHTASQVTHQAESFLACQMNHSVKPEKETNTCLLSHIECLLQISNPTAFQSLSRSIMILLNLSCTEGLRKLEAHSTAPVPEFQTAKQISSALKPFWRLTFWA